MSFSLFYLTRMRALIIGRVHTLEVQKLIQTHNTQRYTGIILIILKKMHMPSAIENSYSQPLPGCHP
jgi:hypothetical protein